MTKSFLVEKRGKRQWAVIRQASHDPQYRVGSHIPGYGKVVIVVEDLIDEGYYDYERQAWVQDGRYVRCGHPEDMNCGCYGRLHAGEPVQA